jgi:CobQ-like glutamine amidotransferase family enzyme
VTADSALRIASLFPEVLGTYGDGGNVLVLQRRLSWRDVSVDVIPVPLGTTVPDQCDLYVLGGGEDDAQTAVIDALRSSAVLTRVADRGVPILAVCAGLQLLGHSFEVHDGAVHPGLGLLDVTTTRLRSRAVGDVVAITAPELGIAGSAELTGFENHGGQTLIGPQARPLARVVKGVGNGGPHREEGATQGSIVATYLHGPVLARNPDLADLLLSRATGRELTPLDIPNVEVLRRERLSIGSGPLERSRDRVGTPSRAPDRAPGSNRRAANPAASFGGLSGVNPGLRDRRRHGGSPGP